METTDGGAAAVIDCVGSTKTMEFGVNALRKGGKLVMVGLYGGSCLVSTVLFPFKMMTIEGSYVGTLEDSTELLALGQAGKVSPIPIEMRPADEASTVLRDLKSGGKVRGRVVLRHLSPDEHHGELREATPRDNYVAPSTSLVIG
jgi:alcohol dehydrogenase, propanol-preferring